MYSSLQQMTTFMQVICPKGSQKWSYLHVDHNHSAQCKALVHCAIGLFGFLFCLQSILNDCEFFTFLLEHIPYAVYYHATLG